MNIDQIPTSQPTADPVVAPVENNAPVADTPVVSTDSANDQPVTQPVQENKPEQPESSNSDSDRFKQRIQEVTKPYADKASAFEALIKEVEFKPELAPVIADSLLSQGKISQQQAEEFKARYKKPESSLQDTKPTDQAPDISKVVSEALNQDPTLKRIRETQEQEEARKRQEVDTFFTNFESTRPEIVTDEDRQLIAVNANQIAKSLNVPFEEAYDLAYLRVHHPDRYSQTISKSKEQVTKNIDTQIGVGAGSGGSNAGTSAEDESIAKTLGLTVEQYLAAK